jgi:4-amino-4-deoxy-L-arabinose transferase-like glycosyltransferase
VPLAWHLAGDAAAYYEWAQRIAGGDWIGREPFYQAPLYPYVLAVCFRAFGEGVFTIRLMQAVWSALAVGCLWYGTVRLFGRSAALVGAMMLAAYVPSIFFDGLVQKASLAGLLVCALWAAMPWAETARKRRAAVLVGILGGLLVLTRENAMVWLPLLAVWVGVQFRGNSVRCRWTALAGYVLGVGLVLVPVGVRNKLVGGEWSVSTFQAGPNFYIGNHCGADGRYQPLIRGHETPAFEQRDATLLAERDLGRTLSAREVSRYWMRRTISDIRAAPVSWLRLMARKMLMVWNRYEVSDVESQYVYAEFSPSLRGLGFVWHFGVLCPLAAVGVVSTWREWRRLWVYYAMIASMAAAVAAFYVLARYRYPLVPLLIPFAAVGCVTLWSQIRSCSWRPLGWLVLVAVPVALVVNIPVQDEKRLNAMAWMNMGVALAEEGNVAGAVGYFRRAVAGTPESPEANNNLAQALALQEDYEGAVPYYKTALAADPTLMGAAYNLGVALEHLGRVDEALKYYARALEVDALDEDARTAIARLERRLP